MERKNSVPSYFIYFCTDIWHFIKLPGVKIKCSLGVEANSSPAEGERLVVPGLNFSLKGSTEQPDGPNPAYSVHCRLKLYRCLPNRPNSEQHQPSPQKKFELPGFLTNLEQRHKIAAYWCVCVSFQVEDRRLPKKIELFQSLFKTKSKQNVPILKKIQPKLLWKRRKAYTDRFFGHTRD